MCEILVNDIFDELREENKILANELSFERDLNQILENIKNYALILKNNCNCSENIEVFKKLNDFEIEYKILKSKQKGFKTEVNTTFVDKLIENSYYSDLNPSTPGIDISNVKSVSRSQEKSVNIRTTTDSSNAVKCECSECHQKFDTELDLVLHINRHHKEIESFVCHECQEVFESEDVFSAHLLEHKGNGGNSLLVPKSKSRNTTITDYLRSYRKPVPSTNTSQTISRNRVIKTENHMRLITEMLKPSGSSQKNYNKSKILSINDMKVETNGDTFDEIRCPECKQSLNSFQELESHIKKSHPSLVCSKCQQWFNSKDEVFAHMSTVHQESTPGRVYYCSSCNFKARDRGNLNRHQINRVCSKGQFKCPNNGCKCSFLKNETLKRHKRICSKRLSTKVESQTIGGQQFDATKGEMVCRFCTFKAKNRFTMIRHQRTHSDERPFICDVNGCNNTYKSKSNLNEHKKRVHKNADQINILRKMNENIRNVSKLDLSQESKVYSNDEPNNEDIPANIVEQDIKLEYISDSDNESSILKNLGQNLDIDSLSDNNINSKQISDAKHSCKLCHFKTPNKVYLMLHEIQEHPELRPFKCDFAMCGKAYTRSSHLSDHKRMAHKTSHKTSHKTPKIPIEGISEGAKLFDCEECHYKTKFEHLLRRHMLSHSPNKPFKCEINGCEYSARRKDILKNHQKRVHKTVGSKFVCNYPNCRRSFDSQLLLKQHMNSHKNRFVCRWEGCQYRTDTFAKLNEHRRNENHIPPQLLI